MDTDKHELVLKDEVYQIVRCCAMAVLNTLGHGLREKPDENALVVEFGLKDIPFQQQTRFPRSRVL
ncbi:MAG: GxxExxY protein [Desulforhopalus sp.]|nr:GxxExxY protein [Desulforhopalus sp.]